MPKARAATKSAPFRIKKGRGGHRAGSLAKCWARKAKLHRDSQLEKHDELEGLQGPIRPCDVDENKKKIVPLDRKFLRSYAENFATDAAPSDLLKMREGVARAMAQWPDLDTEPVAKLPHPRHPSVVCVWGENSAPLLNNFDFSLAEAADRGKR